MLASCLHASGAAFLADWLPTRNTLLVLNYHRIGSASTDPFDPGVFSCTAAELDQQIAFLKERLSVVTLEEALQFVEGGVKEPPRCRVLITFDDGYLDNYTLAFPILRAHRVQGVFFLATRIVGSNHIPWWDHVAFVVRSARRRRFSLRYPAELIVDLDRNGLITSLRDILTFYTRPENTDGERFIRELVESAAGDQPPGTERRFLDFNEAREMVAGGMAIGSHGHSHTVLSQLAYQDQLKELSDSRAVLMRELGVGIDTIAYPVGFTGCFSDTTQKLAREAGYRAGFSFYGGVNRCGAISPHDIRRVSVETQSWTRFRVQARMCKLTAKYWP